LAETLAESETPVKRVKSEKSFSLALRLPSRHRLPNGNPRPAQEFTVTPKGDTKPEATRCPHIWTFRYRLTLSPNRP
jgi:hypothetical protein